MAVRTTFETSDAHQLEARLRQHYGDKVALVDSQVSAVDETMGNEHFLLDQIRFSGSFVSNSETEKLIMLTASGRVDWEVRSEQGNSRLPLLVRPNIPMSAFVEDADITAAVFDPEQLQRTARALYASDSLRIQFDGVTPISERHAKAVDDALTLARETAGLALESDIVFASLQRYLALCALEWFPLHGNREHRSATTRSLLYGYGRARTFIEDFASLPVTVDDVAEAAGLSSRELAAAFRAHSPNGGSAADELRRVRLDAAHRDLVLGDPTRGDRVSTIATRWGFTPARFAQLHKSAYGTTPKWVLDR